MPERTRRHHQPDRAHGEGLQPVINLPPDSDARTFTDSFGTIWRVHERETSGALRARGTRVLVFESLSSLRPIWRFPDHWRTLDDAGLEALSMER